jgi:pSer/pThr/pTyr-binding forkhead associated (FHA) protein
MPAPFRAPPRFGLRYLGPDRPPRLVAGRVYEVFDEGVVLGRGADAGVLVASETVARSHARVCRLAGRLVVEDLNSTNGTRVNGRRVASSPLELGDRLTLADAFEFDVVALPASTRRAAP